MFGRKKYINVENIKSFHDAVKAIKTYIYLTEWSKAQSALSDLKEKETNAFHKLEEKLK